MDADTKETIVGATVFIKSIKKGTYTNSRGYFSIKNIPDGEYDIHFTYIGYEKLSDKIVINQNKDLRRNFLIKSGSLSSQELVIQAEREAEKKNIQISKVDLPVEQLRQIRIGGEADLFRAIQYLPGVLTSSQISNGLYIRGGSPDQNLVQIDGATIYNPSHLLGFISAFNSDFVKDVELLKGGFNAEYGGRMSAVLNLTQRDGNKEKFEGDFSLGLLSSKASIEGPIGNGSFFIGGRRTYFELVKNFISEDPEQPLPDYNFYDGNFRINQSLTDNDLIYGSAFVSQDFLRFGNFGLDFELRLQNLAGAIGWNHIFNKSLFVENIVSYSFYSNGLNGDNSGFELLIDNSITDYSFKSKFEWLINDRLTSRFGLEATHYTFSFLQDFSGDTDSTAEGSSSGSTNFDIEDINASVFFQTNYQLDERTSLQSGLRLNYFDFTRAYKLDPRLALRYQINDKMVLKAAWGIYHQNLKLATQPNFAFFDTWLGTDTTLNIGRSNHYIISLETTPVKGYNLNFDVYYKTLENINEIKNISFEVATAEDALYEGMGEAFGFEIFLQKKYGKFGGWIGYGFGVINAQFDSLNAGRWFNPRYDRRHDFKVVLQWDYSDRWDFGMNFTYQGGQPYTDYRSRSQNQQVGTEVGNPNIFPSDRYGFRLPETHFLNVNATWYFKLFRKKANLVFDVYNIYNRRDIFFRQFIVNDPRQPAEINDVKLLPILPTVTFEINL